MRFTRETAVGCGVWTDKIVRYRFLSYSSFSFLLRSTRHKTEGNQHTPPSVVASFQKNRPFSLWRRSMTADSPATCGIVGGHRPPLQLKLTHDPTSPAG